VSERTIRRWIARRVLPTRKLGGTVRVQREAVAADRVAARRPRRGRPSRAPDVSVSALSDEALAKTWDNPEDAAYDRWREIYGVRQG